MPSNMFLKFAPFGHSPALSNSPACDFPKIIQVHPINGSEIGPFSCHEILYNALLVHTTYNQEITNAKSRIIVIMLHF